MKNNILRILMAATICAIALVIVVSNQTNSSTPTFEDIDVIVLTISGEIKYPGRYTVKKGTSIWDNSTHFGGFSSTADITKTDIYAPLLQDKTVVIKAKSNNDNKNYDSLYGPPK